MQYHFIGAVVGFVNGLLGGGGGALLAPFFMNKMPTEKALASSLAVLLSFSCLSVVIYFVQGNIDLAQAFPYVLGGAVGGIIAGKIFPTMKSEWLKKGFSLLMIVAGMRCLLS
ncbi:MAG: TSUP family transporter [Eubacteriales bacterium]